MLIDKGFSHAIANAILEDSPDNQSAQDILKQPENRLVLDSGKVIDLDATIEEKAIAEEFKGKLSRFTVGT